MNIVIRNYLAKDKADVIRLLIDLQDHVAKLDPWKRNRRRQQFDGAGFLKHTLKELTNFDRLLVAVDGKKVVGLVQVHAPQPSAKSQMEWKAGSKPSGYVEQLMVDQAARGLGVGKKLMKAAEQYLKQVGCGVVFVGCFATNTPTLEFYRSQGYVERNIEFAKKI